MLDYLVRLDAQHGSDSESAAAAHGRRYVAESGRKAAPLGCSGGAAGGAAAVSCDELQLAAASGVMRRMRRFQDPECGEGCQVMMNCWCLCTQRCRGKQANNI